MRFWAVWFRVNATLILALCKQQSSASSCNLHTKVPLFLPFWLCHPQPFNPIRSPPSNAPGRRLSLLALWPNTLLFQFCTVMKCVTLQRFNVNVFPPYPLSYMCQLFTIILVTNTCVSSFRHIYPHTYTAGTQGCFTFNGPNISRESEVCMRALGIFQLREEQSHPTYMHSAYSMWTQYFWHCKLRIHGTLYLLVYQLPIRRKHVRVQGR